MTKNVELKKEAHDNENNAHATGIAVGATMGATAGVVALAAAQGAGYGAAAGIPGIVAGIALGGAIGALAGEDAAASVNPTEEETYWRENHEKQHYFSTLNTYDSYAPAYRFGVDAYSIFVGRDFDEIEDQLGRQWDAGARGSSRLTWDSAKLATRDAYNRLHAKELSV
jgi:hypothetical protein